MQRASDGLKAMSPVDQMYALKHLCQDLSTRGERAVVEQLLLEFGWLQAKLDATDPEQLIADFDFAPQGNHLQYLQETIRLSAHALHLTPMHLPSQLLARIVPGEAPELSPVLHEIHSWHGNTWLRPMTPNLESPGGSLFRTLTGHARSVTAVAATSDCTTLISASYDKTIAIWNLASGIRLGTCHLHKSAVTAAVIAPDNRTVVSGSSDGIIEVWDLETGREYFQINAHPSGVFSLAVTTDGRYAISGEGMRSDQTPGTITVWDLSTGKQFYSLQAHDDGVTSLAIIPNSSLVVSGSYDLTIKVWDIPTGQLIGELRDHYGRVNALAATPGGKTFISASDDKTTVEWDIETGEVIRNSEEFSLPVNAIAVTPDGTQGIAGLYNGQLFRWDLDGEMFRWREEDQAKLVHGHGYNEVLAVIALADNRRIVSAGSDNAVKIWDLAALRLYEKPPGHTEMINDILVTPDGRFAVTAAGCDWESTDNTVKLWDMRTGEELRTLTGHVDHVLQLRFLAEGAQVISVSGSGHIKTWGLETAIEADLEQSGTFVTERGAFERFVASLTRNQASNTINLSLPRQVVVQPDHSLEVWDFGVEQRIHALPRSTNNVNAKAWGTPSVLWTKDIANTPDGRFALTALDDYSVALWSLDSGHLIATLPPEETAVFAVAMTADARLGATATRVGTLKVWDLNTASLIASFVTDTTVTACAFSPDGATIVVGDAFGRVHFLQVEQGH
jgi:WD40 repeat protein